MTGPLRHLADAMTFANSLMGFAAVLVLAVDLPWNLPLSTPYLVAILVGTGTILDALDGIAARKWGSSGNGGAMDLVSDLVSFVIAPGLLMFWVQDGRAPVATLVAATALFASGSMRLVRNLRIRDQVSFRGVPVSWSGPTMIILCLVVEEATVPAYSLPLVALALAAMNVSRVHYPKTHGPGLTKVVLGICIAAVLVVLGLWLLPAQREAILVAAALLATIIVVFSPWLAPLFSK